MGEQTLTTYYSLLGLHGIKGKPAETLFEKNPIVKDAPIFPANEKMGHTGSRPTSMPAPTFRKVSGYTTPGTATWSPYTEDISIVDGAAIIPRDVIRIEGPEKLIYIEAAHREGFIQAIAGHWFQGSVVTAPEKYKSFNERYQTPDNDTSGNSPENPDTTTAAQRNVYDAGGTGSDTTSIWFFRWGAEQVHLISPSNDPQNGVTEEDKGIQTQWSTSTFRNVYVKLWEWWHGIAVPNQACVARIRNIESGMDAIDAGLKKLIFRVINEGLTEGTGTIWMYIPPRLKTHFDVLLEAKQNVIFSRDNPYNVGMPMWGGTIPIQVCQKIPITETYVAAV
jgi:hypothetical protein